MTTLELRVLMGLQAGARMRLGAGRYVLGSSDAADVILAGPRIRDRHAEIVVGAEGATITPLAGPVRLDGAALAAETDLPKGRAVDCDGVWICVAAEGSGWPDVEEIIVQRAARAPPPEPEMPPPRIAPNAAPATNGAKTPPPPPRAARTFPTGLVAPIGVAIVLLAVATGAWLWLPDENQPAPPSPAQRFAALGKAITQKLAEAGFGGRLAIRPAGASWLVSGNVADATERERVRRALLGVSPVPTLRIITDDEISDAVARVMARSGVPMRLALSEPGRARLRVGAANAEIAEQVAQAFRAELGDTREIELEAITPASALPALQELIRNAGLATRVRVVAEGPGSLNIIASGTLPNADIERWKPVAQRFDTDYGGFLALKTAFVRVAAPMPFAVRAVIDGETPQVLTSDGERLLEGGSLRGYRLVSIRPGELVFDGADRVIVPRPKAGEDDRGAASR